MIIITLLFTSFFIFSCGIDPNYYDNNITNSTIKYENNNNFLSGRYYYPTYFYFFGAPAAETFDKSQDTSKETEREIQESDIYKTNGSYLYIMNCYKGLFIIDYSDIKNPVLKGNIELDGIPYDMYFYNNYSIILCNTENNQSGYIHIIDITTPSSPILVKTFEISGYFTDSRIVGQILYTVSTKTSNTIINSINLSTISLIKTLEIEKTSGVIHVTTNALFVAQSDINNWFVNSNFITYVDISSPSGDIQIKSTIGIKGVIKDKFKMDFYNNHLRVISYDWNNNSISYLYSINWSNIDNPYIVSTTNIARGENLFASGFNKDKVFIVTYERKDPLWIIDLSNPSNFNILSELIVPGWSTHIEIFSNFLITVGIDDTSGFRTCISLFDTTSFTNPYLKDKIILGEYYSTSEALNDYRALSIFRNSEFIAIPYSHNNQHLVQIISYKNMDLNKITEMTHPDYVLRSIELALNEIYNFSSTELRAFTIYSSTNILNKIITLVENVKNIYPFQNTNQNIALKLINDIYLRSFYLSEYYTTNYIDSVIINDSKNQLLSLFSVENYIYTIRIPTYYTLYTRSTSNFIIIDLYSVNNNKLKILKSITNYLSYSPYNAKVYNNNNFMAIILNNELYIYDISTPSSPVIKKYIYYGDSIYIENIIFKNNILYISFYEYSNNLFDQIGITLFGQSKSLCKYGLDIIDLSKNIISRKTYNVPGRFIAKTENNYYVTYDTIWTVSNTLNYYLRTIEIKDKNVEIKKSFLLTNYLYNIFYYKNLIFSYSYYYYLYYYDIYNSIENNNLLAFEVKNDGTISEKNPIKLTNISSFEYFCYNDYLYLISYNGYINKLNISSPDNIQLVSQLDIKTQFNNFCQIGNYLYFACDKFGIKRITLDNN